MQPTLLRSHVLIWMGSVMFAALGMLAIIQPNLILAYFSSVAWLVIPSWIISVLLIWRWAVVLGRYDLLVVIPCVSLVAFAFSMSYSADIICYLPDDGNTMFTVLGWGAQPFNFPAQARILGLQMIWAASIAVAGISLKRGLNPISQAVNPPLNWTQKGRLWSCVLIQCSLIVLVTAGLLYWEVIHQMQLPTAFSSR